MPYCETNYFYDEITALLKKVSDEISLNDIEQKKLKELLDRWDDIDCPEAGCRPEKCRFALPIDWVEYHGYPCLWDLIQNLDQSRPTTKIPKPPGIDPLAAKWARRPGHYNP